MGLDSEYRLFARLSPDSQNFIEEKRKQHHFTFQGLKRLIDIARDLEMWGEGPLSRLWPEVPVNFSGRQHTKELLRLLETRWQELKNQEKDYGSYRGIAQELNRETPLSFRSIPKEDKILGRCPVSSEKTRCCQLLTLDVVRNCGFGCSYCSIQSFFGGQDIWIEERLKEKLETLEINPHKIYHIGTGQSSDSLLWGNRHQILSTLLDFARNHPNVILEFKTKSNRITELLGLQKAGLLPPNILCTWTLNTDAIITHEEHGTARLQERLEAARNIADGGTLVGFHIHPMVFYKNWKQDYQDLIQKIQNLFKPEEVALVSFGTVTLIKPLIAQIRARALRSKILQMPLIETAGKFSYPAGIKQKLFQHAYQVFQPWHGKTFFYLCMEDPKLWKEVFGFDYSNNAEFEEDMKQQYLKKIRILAKLH